MPMPDDGGRDISLGQNGDTGLFDLSWDGPNPEFDDTETHTVLSLVLEFQGKWWADQTGKRGSRVFELRNDVSTTQSELVARLQEALSPAVNDGRLQQLSVSAERRAPGYYAFHIRWRTRSGRLASIVIPPLPY
jgi:phage gp46-like protein